MTSKRVLVAGATGLIGKRFVDLVSPRREIVALVRTPGVFAAPVEEVALDLAEADFASSLPSDIGAVVFLAQSRHHAEFPDNALDVLNVNLVALGKVLDWARGAGVEKVCIASTGGLYGPGPKPKLESDPPQIDGRLCYYYATKYAAELLLKAYADIFVGVSLRFFFAYGPEQASNMLMPRIVGNVSDGQPIFLNGGKGIIFNPLHVEDAAMAIDRALDLDESMAINVAGSEVVSLRDVAERIGRHLGREPVLDIRPGAPVDSFVADISKMESRLAPPSILLEQGLAEMCAQA